MREEARDRLASVLRRGGEAGRAAVVDRCGSARVAFDAQCPGLASAVFGAPFLCAVCRALPEACAWSPPAAMWFPRVVRAATGRPLSADPSEWLAGRVVVDAAGLAPSLVSECGHRFCPFCAPRAAARNRRRTVERIEAAGLETRDAGEARWQTSSWVAPFARGFAGIKGVSAWMGDRLAVALAGGPEVEALGGHLGPVASVAAAAAAGDRWVHAHWTSILGPGGVGFWRSVEADDAWRADVEWREAYNWRAAVPSTACGFTAEGFDGSPLVIDGAEPMPMPSRPSPRGIGSIAALRATVKARARTYREIRQAAARERASSLLALSSDWKGWAVRLGHAEARVAECQAAVEALAGDVVIGPVFADGEALPSSWAAWRTRDRERFAVKLQSARGRASIARLHAEAVARQHRAAQEAARLELDAARDDLAALVLERDEVRGKARKAAAHARLWRDCDARFFTFTQPADASETAADAVDRLRRAIRVLCRSATWRNAVAGGVIRLEVERSSPTSRARAAARKRRLGAAYIAAGLDEEGRKLMADADDLHRPEGSSRGKRSKGSHWHAHAHAVLSTGWADQQAWADTWARAMAAATVPGLILEGPTPAGRSERWRYVDDTEAVAAFIEKIPRGAVNVQRPRGRENVIREVTKYVTKPVKLTTLSDVEALDLVEGMRGVRTLRTVGALVGIELEPEERDETEVAEGATLSEALAEGAECEASGATPVIVVGYVRPGDPDLPPLPLRINQIVWRTDRAAQEARRAQAARTWQAHQDRRASARWGEVPAS